MYKELLQLHQTNYKIWCSTVLEVLQSIKVENMFEKQCDLNVDDIDKFRSEVRTLINILNPGEMTPRTLKSTQGYELIHYSKQHLL